MTPEVKAKNDALALKLVQQKTMIYIVEGLFRVWITDNTSDAEEQACAGYRVWAVPATELCSQCGTFNGDRKQQLKGEHNKMTEQQARYLIRLAKMILWFVSRGKAVPDNTGWRQELKDIDATGTGEQDDD